MKIRRISFISLILALIIAACTPRIKGPNLIEATEPQAELLIANVDIFDGEQPHLIKGQDVRIRDGRIVSIEPADPNVSFSSGMMINGQGKTLMPGLIDAHVHVSGSGAMPYANRKADVEYNLKAWLYAGVTTIYDLGGLSSSLNKLRRQVENGEIEGPNIYHTHIPVSVKNSHPIPLTKLMLPGPMKGMVNAISPTIGKPEDAEKIARKYKKMGVDYMKVACDQIPPGSPEMSDAQLEAMVKASHAEDLKVFAHIGSPENALSAVRAGADVLAHIAWRGELHADQAKEIAASGKPMICTLAGFLNVGHIHEGEFQPSEMDRILVPEEILKPVTGENGKQVRDVKIMSDFFADVAEKAPYLKSNFELLHAAGVPFCVGTDAALPGTYPGATYLQELALLHAFGMSPYEALHAATWRNAHLFLDDPDFGAVKVGMRADLLLIEGNPLEDLMQVRQPAMIIKGGQIKRRK